MNRSFNRNSDFDDEDSTRTPNPPPIPRSKPHRISHSHRASSIRRQSSEDVLMTVRRTTADSKRVSFSDIVSTYSSSSSIDKEELAPEPGEGRLGSITPLDHPQSLLRSKKALSFRPRSDGDDEEYFNLGIPPGTWRGRIISTPDDINHRQSKSQRRHHADPDDEESTSHRHHHQSRSHATPHKSKSSHSHHRHQEDEDESDSDHHHHYHSSSNKKSKKKSSDRKSGRDRSHHKSRSSSRDGRSVEEQFYEILQRKILNRFLHLTYPYELDTSKVLEAMSLHSEEGALQPTTDSFWEPGNYKRTTKRIEDGNRLCNDLVDLLHERAEIERAYSRNLKNWAKKWFDNIDKGPEYGTTEAAWKSLLAEADRLSEMHSNLKEDLEKDIIGEIRTWQKDNYHKTVLSIKEKKDMDDSFRAAQKPWSKILSKVNKLKGEYQGACKAEKTAKNQERNAANDSSVSSDQLKKSKDKLEKCRDERGRLKVKYEEALAEITAANPAYIDNMKVVFEQCQDMERRRLRFFKGTFFTVQKCLNISVRSELPQIYDEFHHTIDSADDEKDLKWWSYNHGVMMPMDWPSFEDYTEELINISNRNSKTFGKSGGAQKITLIKKKTMSDEIMEDLDDSASPVSVRGGLNHTSRSKKRETILTDHSPERKNHYIKKLERNPFDPEEEEEDGNEQNNNINADELEGVPVRALYDYTGDEDDELSFKKGEEFEKLEDEDEQGWCKGKKQGLIGLYPANYASEIK